jgi:hypothetical protein
MYKSIYLMQIHFLNLVLALYKLKKLHIMDTQKFLSRTQTEKSDKREKIKKDGRSTLSISLHRFVFNHYLLKVHDYNN